MRSGTDSEGVTTFSDIVLMITRKACALNGKINGRGREVLNKTEGKVREKTEGKIAELPTLPFQYQFEKYSF
jgi:hypothetical protein